MTGTTVIILKLEDLVKQYTFRDKQQQQAISLDYEVEQWLWSHPAKAISITETGHEEAAIFACPDGSRNQGVVGLGVIVFKGSGIMTRLFETRRQILEKSSGEVAIHKALEEIELLSREKSSSLDAIIYAEN